MRRTIQPPYHILAGHHVLALEAGHKDVVVAVGILPPSPPLLPILTLAEATSSLETVVAPYSRVYVLGAWDLHIAAKVSHP